MAGAAALPGLPAGISGARADFEDLPEFFRDDARESWSVFRRSCVAILHGHAPLREALAMPSAFLNLCPAVAQTSVPRSQAEALALWTQFFQPWRLRQSDKPAGFLTGYYEPIVRGSRERTAAFSEPVYGLPPDLVPVPFHQRGEGAAAARRAPGGALAPYADRAAIEAGALAGLVEPVCWLRDGIEVFMVQVQGSARVRLENGDELRLVYAGRNGLPYTSIGRILIAGGEIAEADMSLQSLKDWVRRAGQGVGEPGRRLMQRNESYVFFRSEPAAGEAGGPIGGQGLPLTPLRSIALDRSLWHYGLPVWIDAELPWEAAAPTPFRRLMIGQDTGSAIVGPARFDLFFGSGDAAGRRAGDIRHAADVAILLPKGAALVGAP